MSEKGKAQPVKLKTWHIRMNRMYLSKQICLQTAERILQGKHIDGMSRLEIAQEIYFHACAYYTCKALEKYHIHIRKVIDAADPIDIADNGDYIYRQVIYRVWWHLPSRRHTG